MIKILETKFGLKKGQEFIELDTDGEFTVLRGKRKIAKLPTMQITDIKIDYEYRKSA